MGRCYIIITGKRKSGKDYISEILSKYLDQANIINSMIHLSSHIKEVYAKNHNLNYEDLISSGPYKEKYRYEMVKWGEEQRDRDPGIFCRQALSTLNPELNYSAIIVVAARRETDIKFFINNYGRDNVIIVRLHTIDSVRRDRGWTYTSGIDDRDTEIGLDKWTNWDFEFQNNTLDDCQFIISKLIDTIQQKQKAKSV